MPTLSKRIATLPPYPFAELEKLIAELKNSGVDVITFGVGDPADPTPAFIREAAKHAVDAHASSGYPSYVGYGPFRQAAAGWMGKRFGVTLDPDTEIASAIGSKEAIFNFHQAYIDAGDVVLVPTPGYPPYARGAEFAGGEVHFLPLLSENNFLPDLASIPAEIARRAKILWLNYPNSPTGAVAPDSFWQAAVEFCATHDIILASDLAYSEIYFDAPPKSALQFARSGVIEFHSLSKRSRMTGYRVGFVAGDAELVSAYKKVKTNIDSGTPNFVQDAAIAALADEAHVAEARAEYKIKRDIMSQVFSELGLPPAEPPSTFYMWQRVPEGMSSADFAKRLLAPEIGVVVTPGPWIADAAGSVNPGEGFVRLALVPTIEQTKEAAARIRQYLKI